VDGGSKAIKIILKACKSNNSNAKHLNGIQEVSSSIPLSSKTRRKVFYDEKRGVKSSLFYFF
jgi:hypothetical protein